MSVTINGFKDMKPPVDYSRTDWELEMFAPDSDDQNNRLWFLALGALQMLIGIGIGFWMGAA